MAVKPEHKRDRSTRAVSNPKSSPARNEMEQRFRNLTDDSLQGVLVARGLRPVFVNDTFAAFHGYTCEEILGLESLASLAAGNSRHALQRFIDNISSTAQVSLNMKVFTKVAPRSGFREISTRSNGMTRTRSS